MDTTNPNYSHFKIEDFMAKYNFTITLNVKDVNTQIELPNHVWQGEVSTALRAVRVAERSAQVAYHRRWSKRMQVKYGLTAEQLHAMVEDGLLKVPNLVEVKVESIDTDCFEEAKGRVKPDVWMRLALWHTPKEWW